VAHPGRGQAGVEQLVAGVGQVVVSGRLLWGVRVGQVSRHSEQVDEEMLY
jgi:hypothetical protein